MPRLSESQILEAFGLQEGKEAEDGDAGFLNPRWRAALRRLIPHDRRVQLRRKLIETRGISELVTRLDPGMLVLRVTPETRAVMDGFPRSANTYAHLAFLYANGIDFPMCSHRHSHQSIRTGVRKGLPTIVLIRDPRPAIGSSLQFSPETSAAVTIDTYTTFYEGVLPAIDDVLVATFEEVTDDFGEVTRRCNAKFGSDFVPYEKTEESEAEIFGTIEGLTGFAFGGDGLEEKMPRPSEARVSAEEILAGLSPADQAAMRGAEALYRRVLERRSG
jgi:hypothetical protein